jgi:hypothetical protein
MKLFSALWRLVKVTVYAFKSHWEPRHTLLAIKTLPKKLVKSVNRLDCSLMFSADTLGLDAQMLADITAYLQSDLLR